MIKKILFLVLLATISYSASAQYLTDIHEPVNGNSVVIKYAAKAGVNMTTFSGVKSGAEFSMSSGFQAGVACNVRWGYRSEFSRPGTGLLGCQAELLYSSQAVTVRGSEKVTFNRITLPIMLRAYPTPELYVEAGPEFAYLFGVSPDYLTAGVSVYGIGKCAGLMTDLSLGVGYETKLGFTFGARYGFGLTSLAKNLPWKTNTLSLSAGWMF